MTFTGLWMTCNSQLWYIAFTHFARHFIFRAKTICTGNKIIITIKMTTVKGKAPFENAGSCGKPPLGGILTMAAI